MNYFNIFMTIIAIENLAEILTTVDLFEPYRSWFQGVFPDFGKLAVCKYCQMFWLSVLAVCFDAPLWLVTILAFHRLAQIFSEFVDRYMNRAPVSLYVQQNVVNDKIM